MCGHVLACVSFCMQAASVPTDLIAYTLSHIAHSQYSFHTLHQGLSIYRKLNKATVAKELNIQKATQFFLCSSIGNIF